MKGGTSKFGLPYTVLERGLITVLKFNCMFTGHDLGIVVYAVFIFNNCSFHLNNPCWYACYVCLSASIHLTHVAENPTDCLLCAELAGFTESVYENSLPLI